MVSPPRRWVVWPGLLLPRGWAAGLGRAGAVLRPVLHGARGKMQWSIKSGAPQIRPHRHPQPLAAELPTSIFTLLLCDVSSYLPSCPCGLTGRRIRILVEYIYIQTADPFNSRHRAVGANRRRTHARRHRTGYTTVVGAVRSGG